MSAALSAPPCPLRRRPAYRPERGSVLIVALLLAAIIAISLTSYIRLAINSVRLADRSYYLNSAVNLAEMGVEEALYAYNQLEHVATPADAWTGWTIQTNESATRTLPAFTLGPGVSGVVKIYSSVYNPDYTKPDPVVVSKATVTFPDGSDHSKYVEVRFRKRSLWTHALVVRETITSVGNNLYVDSWNSRPDPAQPAVAYSDARKTPRGSLATTSNVNGAINISGGEVYGTISMGGAAEPDYHKNNAILSNTFTVNPALKFNRDLVLNDFMATFPNVSPPNVTPPNVIDSAFSELPRTGDVQNAADGFYYYTVATGHTIEIGGNSNVNINEKVVLIANAHYGVDAIEVKGTATLTIEDNAALRLYTNGHVKLGGGGMANKSEQPYACIIYGTGTTPGGQTFDLRGNSGLQTAVYAPNANLNMNGGGGSGEICGAMVANRAAMSGNARFHYDEALATMVEGNPYGIAHWRELQTAGERAGYATQLSF
jgi:hypothetical protein